MWFRFLALPLALLAGLAVAAVLAVALVVALAFPNLPSLVALTVYLPKLPPQIYFGKSLEQLSLAETAMLAGLPKAPSMYNPVANLQRARQRQRYVLRRMSELGHITAAQYEDAAKEPLRPRREANEYAIHGEYAAEMVR